MSDLVGCDVHATYTAGCSLCGHNWKGTFIAPAPAPSERCRCAPDMWSSEEGRRRICNAYVDGAPKYPGECDTCAHDKACHDAPAPMPDEKVLTREEYRETLRKAENAAHDFGAITNVNDHRHTVRLWNHYDALCAEVERLKRERDLYRIESERIGAMNVTLLRNRDEACAYGRAEAAKCDRMRTVVDAAIAWYHERHVNVSNELAAAVKSYERVEP